MFDLEDPATQGAERRIAALEARIAQLEAAISRMLGEPLLAPPEADFAKTLRLSVLDQIPAAEPAARTDNLGITAAFATLDTRVAEAAEAEASLQRQPDLSHVVPIQPELADNRFERKPIEPARRTSPVRMFVRSALEVDHAKILTRLEMTWRTPECREYLNRLIVSDRPDRAGFSPQVMTELLLLSEVLDAAGEKDTWSANARAV